MLTKKIIQILWETLYNSQLQWQETNVKKLISNDGDKSNGFQGGMYLKIFLKIGHWLYCMFLFCLRYRWCWWNLVYLHILIRIYFESKKKYLVFTQKYFQFLRKLGFLGTTSKICFSNIYFFNSRNPYKQNDNCCIDI